MRNQLNRGLRRRVMYVENKSGTNQGVNARIGWVTFSKSGRAIYFRERTLLKGNGISANFFDEETGEWFWVSGVKKRGSNAHPAERAVAIEIDEDALDAYREIRSS
jgi:hypothetical protein